MNILSKNRYHTIIYSSVGLKQYEKNLLLKLKKELDFITPDYANKLYDELEEDEYVNDHRNESKLINETMKKLFLRNGINNQTKNKESQGSFENNKYDSKKYFFRSSEIYDKFRKHKSIKDIENLNETMRYLADRGFLGKLENKYNRANVYYLNQEVIEDINKEYILTNEDIEKAINYFHENFKENPLDPNSKSLFKNNEMLKIQKNYNSFDISKIERYD